MEKSKKKDKEVIRGEKFEEFKKNHNQFHIDCRGWSFHRVYTSVPSVFTSGYYDGKTSKQFFRDARERV